MSDNVLAIIRIGGRLDATRAETLIDAITETQVFAGEGDTCFVSRSIEDLVAATDDDGCLQLCDDSAPWGEMPAIAGACRELGLSYRLWHEATTDCGPEVTWWAPGMGHPESVPGDHMDSDTVLVHAGVVEAALAALRKGGIEEAAALLASVVTRVEVPRLDVVEVGARDSVGDGL
jgi:hypothetical protein